jgi:hypothetical protein
LDDSLFVDGRFGCSSTVVIHTGVSSVECAAIDDGVDLALDAEAEKRS